MPKQNEHDSDLLPGIDGLVTPAGEREAPTGVRRVNNMPLLIIGGVLVVFVVLVAMVAAQRGAKKDPAETVAAPLSEGSQALDQMLAHSAVGGIIEDPDTETSPSFAVARLNHPDAPPVPERDRGDEPGGVDNPRASERMKLFQTAMQAKTGITRAQANQPVAATKGKRMTTGSPPPRQQIQTHVFRYMRMATTANLLERER